MATLVGMNSLTTIGTVITRPPLSPVPSGPGYDPEGDFNGTNGADVLRGTNDSILEIFRGYGGNDQLFGNGGTDWLTGGWGADLIDGGDGANDTVIYDDSPEGVEVNLATGRGTWGTANGDVIVNCEDLVGSNYNDVLIGDAGVNRLHGLKGDDRLMGGAGADYLEGYEGRDTADYSDSTAAVTAISRRGWASAVPPKATRSRRSKISSARRKPTPSSAARTTTIFMAAVAMTCSRAPAAPIRSKASAETIP
jgi:Ca2+-binding RTX toxin-like protein